MTASLRVRTADGLDLHVRTDGRHEASGAGRTPILCVPGLTRNGRDFTGLAERYAPQRFVVRVDLRGRGESSYDPTGASYTPDRYAADVVQVLDALGIGRAVFVGTSLGGSVSMLTATLHPDRVAAVVLNDVGPKLEPTGFARIQAYAGKLPPNDTWDAAVAQLRSLYGAVADAIPDDTFRRMVREQYREFAPGDIRPDHDPRIVAGMETVDPQAIGDTWPLFAGLASIPTLVLRGAVSDLFAASTVDEMQRRKPDLVAVTVPGRGHCPLLDEPESLAALDAFLAGV